MDENNKKTKNKKNWKNYEKNIKKMENFFLNITKNKIFCGNNRRTILQEKFFSSGEQKREMGNQHRGKKCKIKMEKWEENDEWKVSLDEVVAIDTY